MEKELAFVIVAIIIANAILIGSLFLGGSYK